MQRSHFLAFWNKGSPSQAPKDWELCLREFQNIGGRRLCCFHQLHPHLSLWTNDPRALSSESTFRSGGLRQGYVEFDAKSKDVLIHTDDLGLGLFYYTETSDFIVFCSEFEPLLSLIPDFAINAEAVHEFLSQGMTLGNKTFLEEIQMSAPGALLRLTERQDVLWSSKSFRAARTDLSLEEAADYGYVLIKNEVRQIFDQKEIKALALTGGSDTRLILSCLSAEERRERLFWFNTAFHEKIAKVGYDLEVVRMLELEYKLKLDTDLFPRSAGPSPIQPAKNFQRISDDDYRHFTLTGMFGGEILGGQAHVALGLSAPSFETANFCISQFCRSFATSIYHDADSLPEFDRLWRHPHYFFYTRESPFWSVDLIKFILSLPPEYYLNYRLYQKIYERHAADFLKIPFHSPIAFGNKSFQFHPGPKDLKRENAPVHNLRTVNNDVVHPVIENIFKSHEIVELKKNVNFGMRMRALNDFMKISLEL